MTHPGLSEPGQKAIQEAGRMQMAHDLWRLEQTMRAELERIPTHRAA
jgi:hypothetical protein